MLKRGVRVATGRQAPYRQNESKFGIQATGPTTKQAAGTRQQHHATVFRKEILGSVKLNTLMTY